MLLVSPSGLWVSRSGLSLALTSRHAPQRPSSSLGVHTSIDASMKPSASISLSYCSHQFVLLPSTASSPGALRPHRPFLAAAKVSTTRRIVSGSFHFLFKVQVACIPYISAGDPDFSATAQALKVLHTCGSDIIELGLPHSDPLADDPVIQAAATRSLASGSNVDAIISMWQVVLLLSSPVALLSNFNPILKLGVEKLMSILIDAGVQGLRPSRVYDVFISYKQDDVLHPVSHLKSALERREIKTFVDFTLDGGVEFQVAIDKAIKRSEIAVVIVSQNFHSSPWCLIELVKILEWQKKWGLIVLPIFWGIDAKELREQSRLFVENIGQGEKGFKQENPHQVQRWRDALRALGMIKGWSVSSRSDKTEADVIEDLADKISAKLNP